MGTFSVGDIGAGSLFSTTTASGTGEGEGFSTLAANPCAMSSKVLPFVSGTRR